MEGIEAVIELKEGLKARFCKSRPIPFALQEQVEQYSNCVFFVILCFDAVCFPFWFLVL